VKALPISEWVVALDSHSGSAANSGCLRVVHDLLRAICIQMSAWMKESSDSTVPEIAPKAFPRELIFQTEVDVSKFHDVDA
jgi:hypothetical protein